MLVDLAGRTHIGLRRKENQDGFLAERLTGPDGKPLVCLAVADGMGGHQEGQRASMEAIASVRSGLERLSGEPNESWATSVELDAHKRVGKIGAGDEIVGTTLTVAMLLDYECVIGHVGDTRAYRLHQGTLSLLTSDHTWEAFAKLNGLENPHGKALRQAIGVGETVEVETSRIALQDGDALLLCSDGLYKMVAQTDIERVLLRARSAEAACNDLLDLALRAGGRDNIAICVGRMGAARVAAPKLSPLAILILIAVLLAFAIVYLLATGQGL